MNPLQYFLFFFDAPGLKLEHVGVRESHATQNASDVALLGRLALFKLLGFQGILGKANGGRGIG